MNFTSLFKNLKNLQLPYSIQSEPYHVSDPWQLYEAYYSSSLNKSPELKDKKLTVFKPVPGADKDLVLNCLKFVKRLKLPGLCKVVDVIDDRAESSLDSVLIVTEFVRPVSSILKDGDNVIGYNGLLLGVFDLFQLMNVLDSKFVLGTICLQNLYFNELGEWCFFGLDCCIEREQLRASALESEFGRNLKVWCAQSGVQLSEKVLANGDYTILDRVSFGLLIKELFDGKLPRAWETYVNSLSDSGRVPVERVFKQIKASNTFKNSVLLSMYDESKELKITVPKDRIRLMRSIAKFFLLDNDDNKNIINELTPGIITNLIVTELCCPSLDFMLQESITNMQQYHADIVLGLTLMLTLLTTDKHCLEVPVGNKISELIFKLFRVSDRQIRFVLLLFLQKIFDSEMGPKIVFPNNSFRDRIFPFFLQGFIDTDKSIRMMTLKATPKVVDQLSDRQLNNEILRSIAKTQVDGDKNIRTETVLVVIKIAGKLNKLSNRDNILATIFTKSLKDPNIETKLASLYGLKECLDLFSPEVIANKIMSVIAPGLLDKDKLIRAKAKELFDLYVERLESEAAKKYGDDSAENWDGVQDGNEVFDENRLSRSAELETQELEMMIHGFVESLHIVEDITEGEEAYAKSGLVTEPSAPVLSNHSGLSPGKEIVIDGADDDDADWGTFDDFGDDTGNNSTTSPMTTKTVHTAHKTTATSSLKTKHTSILQGTKKSSLITPKDSTANHAKRLSILSRNAQNKHDTPSILSKSRSTPKTAHSNSSSLGKQNSVTHKAISSTKTQNRQGKHQEVDNGDDDFDAWDEEW